MPDLLKGEKLADIRDLFRELLAQQHLAVLCTHDRGQPYASLVAFTATDDFCNVVFATKRNTSKYANLKADARVAVLVEDTTNKPEDFERAAAVTLVGRVRELDKDVEPGLVGFYLEKHPQLAGFIGEDDCAVFCVDVESFTIVDGFDHITKGDVAELF